MSKHPVRTFQQSLTQVVPIYCRQMCSGVQACLRQKVTHSLSHPASTHAHTRTNTHTQPADCSMFVSAPHTPSSSILVAPRRLLAPPHASSPNLPRYRRGAANLSKARAKGSSDDNKAWAIFHENEVLWHSLQWPGREREKRPNKWMQSSYVEFFFI